jgi:hypothetical protein
MILAFPLRPEAEVPTVDHGLELAGFEVARVLRPIHFKGAFA